MALYSKTRQTPFLELWGKYLSWATQAAIVKYHSPSGLNKTHSSSQALEAGGGGASTVGVSCVSLLAYRRLPSCCMLTWLGGVWVGRARWGFLTTLNDTNPILSGFHLITLLNCNYLPVVPASKYSHTVDYSFNMCILRRCDSVYSIYQTYKTWQSLKYPWSLIPHVPFLRPF